jgi:hypothetical protein
MCRPVPPFTAALTRPRSNNWKTGDQDSALAAFLVQQNYEPLLRSLLEAKILRHGPDDHRSLEARLNLGETLAAASRVVWESSTYVTSKPWGDVPHTEADSVLCEALDSVYRSGLPLTSDLAVRAITARAALLSEHGQYVDAAALLQVVLQAFVRRDGGYTRASFGKDGGLSLQIRTVAKHAKKARAQHRIGRVPCRRIAAC